MIEESTVRLNPALLIAAIMLSMIAIVAMLGVFFANGNLSSSIIFMISQGGLQIVTAAIFFQTRRVSTRAWLLAASVISALAVVLVSGIAYANSIALIGGDPARAGADGFYFSVVTLTTLGYGDLQPLGGLRVLASLEALYGFFITPLLIAQAIALFQRKNT